MLARTWPFLVAAVVLDCGSPNRDLYVLKQERHGTRLRHDVATGNLPFDKSYEQLTENQKQLVRSHYENLPSGDEPPYPIGGMKAITSQLAEAQQALLLANRLRAVALVDEGGKVQKVHFLEVPDEEVAKIIAWILVNTPFKPGYCAGKGCTMEFPINVTFQVR